MTAGQLSDGLSFELRRWLAWAQIAIALVGSTAAIWYVVVWFTGGLTPQTQLDTRALTQKVDGLQLTADQIRNRLDSIPSPYDFSEMHRIGREHTAQIVDLQTKFAVLAASLAACLDAQHRAPQK